jgi:hypothetical protein
MQILKNWVCCILSGLYHKKTEKNQSSLHWRPVFYKNPEPIGQAGVD